MPFTKEQKLEFARRVREGGLSERIAVEAEIEADRKKRPGCICRGINFATLRAIAKSVAPGGLFAEG